MSRTCLIALSALMAACGGPSTDEALDRVATDYLTDRAARRAALERALWQPDLPYSRQLLANYALEAGGWELLPLLDTPVAAVLPGETPAEALAARGRPLPTDAVDPVALGREVFFRLPMRSDDYLDWLLTQPHLWERAGVERADGAPVGVVAYEQDGAARVGVACAFCHAAGGEAGRASRTLDVGWVRARYAEARGLDPARFDAWGPGRLDVTDDGTDGPTVVPDLWHLADARHLNHAGVLAVESPMTLAIRFETQYVLGHEVARRPHRSQMWALTTFVRSLTPPAPVRTEAAEAGRAVFQTRCAGCHDPAHGYGGGLAAADSLVSDPTVAHTPERGTGYYKIPSLRGVAHGAPYLHDGSAATLEALLATGHPHGAAVPPGDRADLIDFLMTL